MVSSLAMAQHAKQPPRNGGLVTVSFKLEAAIVEAIDEEAVRMTVERPGVKFTRTDVIRNILHEGMTTRSQQQQRRKRAAK